MKTLEHPYNRQRGAAALLVAVVLLFASTLIVLYAGKVGVQDQRISGNDNRAKQAFANAEAGLDRISAYLLENYPAIAFPTSINSTAEPYYIAYATTAGDHFSVVSTGYSEGYAGAASGTADVQQKFGIYSLFSKGPDAPLTVAGTVPPVGNMEIVGNPNGAGTGVDVSVWTDGPVNISGSGGTCQLAEYLANGSPTMVGNIQRCAANSCSCEGTISGSISSQAKGIGNDIVNFGPFPADLFEHVFGYATADYEDFRDNEVAPDHVISPGDCSDPLILNQNSHGIYWVESAGGTCDLPNGDIGGAYTCGSGSEICSVVLILADTRLQSTGGSTNNFFGLIFSFDIPGNGVTANLHMAGSTAVYGAMFSDHDLNTSNIAGSFDLRYDRTVLDAIVNDKENKRLGRVAGTWIDED